MDTGDPRVRVEIEPGRGRMRTVQTFCTGCGASAAVGLLHDAERAVDLTVENLTARPCCPTWSDPAQIPGQTELTFSAAWWSEPVDVPTGGRL